MSSQNDDGDTAEYASGQSGDSSGLVFSGLGIVGIHSGEPQGYSIGTSSPEDGGGGSQDGEVGESIWHDGPIPGWEMSKFVDLDGDAFSPQALQQMAQGLSGLAFKPVPVPTPANYSAWLDAVTEGVIKRTQRPILEHCVCGSPFALQDIQTSTTDMTHLDVLVACINCKRTKTFHFQPQGDEQVGPSYDAVAINYFKKTEEKSDVEAT